jgi:hypothetical protein
MKIKFCPKVKCCMQNEEGKSMYQRKVSICVEIQLIRKAMPL